MTVREVVERIDARLLKLGGITDREASLLSGQADRIRGLRRRLEDGKGEADVTERTLRPLAAALKTTTLWLDSGIGPEDSDAESPDQPTPVAASEPSDTSLVDLPILQAGLETALITGGMPPDRAAKFAATLIEKARQHAAKRSNLPPGPTPQSLDL